jgi:hypothetical protein
MEKRLILAREAGKKTSKVAAQPARVDPEKGRLLRERADENRPRAI